MQPNNVRMVTGDQCQFGAEVVHGNKTGRPIKKPTGFMTNSVHIADQLALRCKGLAGKCSRAKGGEHAMAEGRIARDASVYPRELCRAVLRGVSLQLKDERKLKAGCYGIQAVDDEEEIKESIYSPANGYSGQFRDDMTGQVLRDDLVKIARATELEWFHSKQVWLKVPRGRARDVTGRPPISVRWVDVNKGDEDEPKYRSRLVARQLKVHDKSNTSFFSPTPPLGALRAVLSLAMTRTGEHQPVWDPEPPSVRRFHSLIPRRHTYRLRLTAS